MALKLNPNSAECHFNIANAFNDKGQKNLALSHFKDSLKFDPNNAEAHYEIGEIYVSLAQNVRAKEAFNKVIEI